MRYLEHVEDGVEYVVSALELLFMAIVVTLKYALACTIGVPFALLSWFVERHKDRKIMKSIERIGNETQTAPHR